MAEFTPSDPDFERKIGDSFARLGFIRGLGAELVSVRPGQVEIRAVHDDRLTQQDGFLHAGAVAALVDTACGYAAYSLMPAGTRVLTVEFKVNFLSAARGDRFLARGSVIKPGRTLTVCDGKLYAFQGGEERLVAVMQATMICIEDGGG
jgi:uncharacterized protein (TIGR00369 family)